MGPARETESLTEGTSIEKGCPTMAFSPTKSLVDFGKDRKFRNIYKVQALSSPVNLMWLHNLGYICEGDLGNRGHCEMGSAQVKHCRSLIGTLLWVFYCYDYLQVWPTSWCLGFYEDLAVMRPLRLKTRRLRLFGLKKCSFSAFYCVNLASMCQTRESLLYGCSQMFF